MHLTEEPNIFHPTDHAREMSYRGRDAAIVKDRWRKQSGPQHANRPSTGRQWWK